jgi:predicted transcriptional regulator
MTKRAARQAAGLSTSIRVSPDTVKRVDALVVKLAHLGIKRAAVFKLAIARGLDVLEREYK